MSLFAHPDDKVIQIHCKNIIKIWGKLKSKMPKIDTLDALEEHEEHEDDYQTNSNW